MPPSLLTRRIGNDFAKLVAASLFVALSFLWREAVDDWMKRWVQDVDGYILTLVNGVATYKLGQPTGALPGGLVRNPRADASKFQNVARKVSAAFDGFVPDFQDDGSALDALHKSYLIPAGSPDCL